MLAHTYCRPQYQISRFIKKRHLQTSIRFYFHFNLFSLTHFTLLSFPSNLLCFVEDDIFINLSYASIFPLFLPPYSIFIEDDLYKPSFRRRHFYTLLIFCHSTFPYILFNFTEDDLYKPLLWFFPLHYLFLFSFHLL